jgi:hypothetical protein
MSFPAIKAPTFHLTRKMHHQLARFGYRPVGRLGQLVWRLLVRVSGSVGGGIAALCKLPSIFGRAFIWAILVVAAVGGISLYLQVIQNVAFAAMVALAILYTCTVALDIWRHYRPRATTPAARPAVATA